MKENIKQLDTSLEVLMSNFDIIKKGDLKTANANIQNANAISKSVSTKIQAVKAESNNVKSIKDLNVK
jgi:hypothetical protein